MTLTKILHQLKEIEDYLEAEGVGVWDESEEYKSIIDYYYKMQIEAISLVAPVCVGKRLEDVKCSEPLKSILKGSIHQLSRGFLSVDHNAELSLSSEELRLVKDSLK